MNWHNLNIDQLLQNQFFTGAFAAGIIGAVVMQGKSVLQWLWKRFYSLFITSIDLNSEDSVNYQEFADWVFSQKTFQNIKTLVQKNKEGAANYVRFSSAESAAFHTNKGTNLGLSPDKGTYYGRIGWRPVWIRCSAETNAMKGGRTLFITAYTLGFSNKYFKQILEKISDKGEDKTIWVNCGYGNVFRKTKRPWSTVFLQGNLKESIEKDVDTFLASREDYEKHGITWKRNYLFVGPPGTGKSSLLLALASKYGRNINLINADATDDKILEHYSQGRNKIIAFEDIDGMNINLDRESKDFEKEVNLSTILNCLDGLNSAVGSITIITTNCPEKLDPALTRAGRIDKTFHLQYFSKAFAIEIAENFLERSKEECEVLVNAWFPNGNGNYIVPAELQENLYSFRFNK